MQIMQLTSLHILDLSNTCLSGLPPTLAALTSLQELLLGACCFRRVPAALLCRLGSLQVLDMSRNAELELEGLFCGRPHLACARCARSCLRRCVTELERATREGPSSDTLRGT